MASPSVNDSTFIGNNHEEDESMYSQARRSKLKVS